MYMGGANASLYRTYIYGRMILRMSEIGGPQPGLEGCSRGLYRLIRPRRFVLRAQNSPNATPKPPTGPCWLTCSLTNMPNTGTFSADMRAFKIHKNRKIAVLRTGPPASLSGKILDMNFPPPCPRYIHPHFFLVYVHVRVLVKIKQILIETAISTLKRPN